MDDVGGSDGPDGLHGRGEERRGEEGSVSGQRLGEMIGLDWTFGRPMQQEKQYSKQCQRNITRKCDARERICARLHVFTFVEKDRHIYVLGERQEKNPFQI